MERGLRGRAAQAPHRLTHCVGRIYVVSLCPRAVSRALLFLHMEGNVSSSMLWSMFVILTECAQRRRYADEREFREWFDFGGEA
jgi:hypothetical protein